MPCFSTRGPHCGDDKEDPFEDIDEGGAEDPEEEESPMSTPVASMEQDCRVAVMPYAAFP